MNERVDISPVPRIALTRQEAAMALAMSLDSFEEYVQPHIRMLRWGRMRLVPVEALREFVDQVAERPLR